MTPEEQQRIKEERDRGQEAYYDEQEMQYEQRQEEEYYEEQLERRKFEEREAKRLKMTLGKYYEYLKNINRLNELRK